MNVPIVSTTPAIAMTLDLAGKTPAELAAMWLELKNEFNSLDCDFNENFTLDPAYSAQYKYLRKPLEEQAALIMDALEPAYLAQFARDRARAVEAGCVAA